jgi:hypothetical protein
MYWMLRQPDYTFAFAKADNPDMIKMSVEK